MSRLTIFLSFVALFSVNSAFSQKDSSVLRQAQTDQGAQDTFAVKPGKAYILIIPFSPKMYFNNGDHFICKSGNMTPGELSDLIRRSLSSTMKKNLSLYYNAKELDNLDILQHGTDFERLHELVQYRTSIRAIKSFFKGYPSFSLSKIAGSENARWGTDCLSGSKSKPDRNFHEYAQPVIGNDSLYHEIVSKYEANYVLLLNRFEVFTRFKNCLDLQQSVFQRDIFITYTLTDSHGKYIDGGVVGTTFQSGTNDIREIGEANFGILTALIVDLVRKNI